MSGPVKAAAQPKAAPARSAPPQPARAGPREEEKSALQRPGWTGVVLRKPLTASSGDDPLEHEADAVAARLMRPAGGHGAGGGRDHAGATPNPAAMLQIQRTAGNRATQLIARKEADRLPAVTVAGAVPTSSGLPTIYRKCACGGAEEECGQCHRAARLQRSEDTSAAAGPMRPGGVLHALGLPGEPLPPAVRARFEPAFGRDFGNVRVHRDSIAAASAKDLNAAAYTVGRDIVFARGRFAPESAAGSELIAHELTHVVQQSAVAEQPIGRADAALVEDRERERASGDVRRGRERIRIVREPSLFERAVGSVRGGVASVVRQFSPDLADLIDRGPLKVLREYLFRWFSEWIHGLAGSLGLSGELADLRKWFAEARASLDDALAGGRRSCARFARLMASLHTFAIDLLQHPVVVAFRGFLQKMHEAFASFVSLFVEAEFQRITLLWEAIRGFANRVTGWVEVIRERAPDAWSWISDQLGLGQSNSEILASVQELATEAWSYIRNDLAPQIFSRFRQLVGFLWEVSGLKTLAEVIRVGQKVMAAIAWVWENRDKDNLLELAKQSEFKDTILPALIEGAQNLGASLKQGVSALVGDIQSGVSGALRDLEEQALVLPLVGPVIGELLQHVRELVDRVEEWANEEVPKIVDAVQTAAAELWEEIKPIVNVAALLAIGLSNPALLPVILPPIMAAAIWHFLPECYKEPIIDVLLDIALAALRAMPDLPLFGPLWSLFKPGVIGFLASIRGAKREEKIGAANQLAKIILYSGLEFMTGFVWGFLKGVWESVTDPFKVLSMLANGIGSLLVWVDDAISRFIAPPQRAEGAGATPEDLDAVGHAAALGLLQGMVGEMRPPAETIRDNFFEAIRDHFSGSRTTTFETLRTKLGAAWDEAQVQMEQKGAALGREAMQALLAPNAVQAAGAAIFKVAEFIGWLIGTIVTEIVIFILSAGIASGAKGALKVLSWIARAIDKAGDILFVPFKLLGKFGSFLTRITGGLGRIAGNAASAVTRRVTDAFGKLATILQKYSDAFWARFGEKAVQRGMKETGEEIGEEVVEKVTIETAETAAGRGGADVAEAAQGGLPASRTEPTPPARTETPEAPAPRTQQDELLQQSGRKHGSDLTDAEFNAEVDFIRFNQSQLKPSTMDGYLDEITLPNRHTWRRGPEGQWCRFTEPMLMTTPFNPEPTYFKKGGIWVPEAGLIVNDASTQLATLHDEVRRRAIAEQLSGMAGSRPTGRNIATAAMTVLVEGPPGTFRPITISPDFAFQSGARGEVAKAVADIMNLDKFDKMTERLFGRPALPWLDFHSERAILLWMQTHADELAEIVASQGIPNPEVKFIVVEMMSTRYVCPICARATLLNVLSRHPMSLRSVMAEALTEKGVRMAGGDLKMFARAAAEFPFPRNLQIPELKRWLANVEVGPAGGTSLLVTDIDIRRLQDALERNDQKSIAELMERIRGKGIPITGAPKIIDKADPGTPAEIVGAICPVKQIKL